jgi:hypothetical protein
VQTSEIGPHRSSLTSDRNPALERRALAMWPRLEPAALRRCHSDPRRIAALVARRTSIPQDAIIRLLTMPAVSDDDVGMWFG